MNAQNGNFRTKPNKLISVLFAIPASLWMFSVSAGEIDKVLVCMEKNNTADRTIINIKKDNTADYIPYLKSKIFLERVDLNRMVIPDDDYLNIISNHYDRMSIDRNTLDLHLVFHSLGFTENCTLSDVSVGTKARQEAQSAIAAKEAILEAERKKKISERKL